MKFNYEILSSDMKVLTAVRLEEKRAEIENKEYDGLTKSDLERVLEKLNAGLTEKQIKKSVKNLMDWGVIRGSVRKKGENNYARTIIVAQEAYETADVQLKALGWLKEESKLTVQ
jgi:hypothetical protein